MLNGLLQRTIGRSAVIVRWIAAVVVSGVLLTSRFAPAALAQSTPDPSNVVIVLDFSGSIIQDASNRDQFAAALVRIADRVDATTGVLVSGDATMSIIQFATTAADYPGCVELKTLNSPSAVARFSGCLRSVAAAYRKGPDPALEQRIGIDTNYVAAMEAAARHLPADSVRPALILFTDGKHDAAGVPVSEVQPTRDRLFGSRSPFALLPVGMGLDPTERPALESGLENLRIVRAMPACVSGARFDWPQVVFGSPDAAGNAVAVALQDATCTFTVAPTASPPAASSPTPAPTAGAVGGIQLDPGDGRIDVSWTAPAVTPAPITGYQVRCRTGSGDWPTPIDVAASDTSATVTGLTNGAPYECQVAAADATSLGTWTAAATTVTPVGPPAAPPKPTVEALDRAIRLGLPSADPALVSSYRYECSADGGHTWTAAVSVSTATGTAGEVGNLSNGVDYVCRAIAINATAESAPSELSAVVRPCGSTLECNPLAPPLLGLIAAGSLVAALVALLVLLRGRTRGYVIAVVDVVHTANLGAGGSLGVTFERPRPGGPVTGIVADRTRNADIRIRVRGGDRFEVRDALGRHTVASGEPLVIADRSGVRHEIVLRAFRTATAAARDRR